MELLVLWFDKLMAEPSLTLRASLTARGECRRLGANPWFAAVKLTISPSSTLEVENLLDSSTTDMLIKSGLYDEILFGVLDIMLTHHPGPIRDFKLTVQEVETDPVRTTPRAMRLAARDAALKILSASKIYPPNFNY